MSHNKPEYIVIRVAIALLVVSVTLLLVFSAGNLQPLAVLLFSTWILAVASGVYLFIFASKWILSQKAEAIATETAASSEKRDVPARNEPAHLDIQSLAGKIVRRISSGADPEKWGTELLSYFVSEIEIMSGIVYLKNSENLFTAVATYAYPHSQPPFTFIEGEGITGQVAKNRQVAVYRSIPDNYRKVFSGLGSSKPAYLGILPVILNDTTIAVIELAGFRWAEENLEQLFQIVARELTGKLPQADATGSAKRNSKTDTTETEEQR